MIWDTTLKRAETSSNGVVPSMTKHDSPTRLIEVDGLTKAFGSVAAVNGVTFHVNRGEVLGFLGPNGAGKSTTMRMITGYLTPTSGTARIGGADVRTEPKAVKQKIGYLPEGAPLYGDMTPESYLDFSARIRHMNAADRARSVKHVIARLQLEEVLCRRIETLSKGFKRRLGLAQALLHDPEVLILDEPTDGLDPNQKHAVRQLINDISKDKAIIISTHLLEEVDAICDRAIIIDHGVLVGEGTPAELQARADNHNAVAIALASSLGDKAAEFIRAMPEILRVSVEHSGAMATLRAYPRNHAFVADIVAARLRAQALDFHELHTEAGRLDLVFRQLTLPSQAA